MKIYIHYEDHHRCLTTKLECVADQLSTVETVITRYVETVHIKSPNFFSSPQDIKLKTEDGEVLSSERKISGLLNDGDDLYVVIRNTSVSPPPVLNPPSAIQATAASTASAKVAASSVAVSTTSTSTAAASRNPPSASNSDGAAGLSTSPTSDSTIPFGSLTRTQQLVVNELSKIAADAYQKSIYTQAISYLKQILSIVCSPEAQAMLGKIYSNAQKWELAIEFWAKACFSTQFKNMEYLLEFANAQNCHKDYEGAAVTLNKAIELIGDSSALVPPATVNNIKVLMGSTLYAMGNQDSGIALFIDVLKNDDKHIDAYIHYSNACFDRKLFGDAIRLSLQVVVHHPNDKKARRHLSTMMIRIPKDCPLEDSTKTKALGCTSSEDLFVSNRQLLLYNELYDAMDAAPALALMAVVLKDNGAVEEGCEFYRRCCKLCPSNSSYALNYIHALELLKRQVDALKFVITFLKNNLDMKVSDVSCGDVLETLKTLDLDAFRTTPDSKKHCVREFSIRCKDLGKNGLAIDRQWNIYYAPAKEFFNLQQSVQQQAAKTNSVELRRGHPQSIQVAKFTAEELDLLALWFSIVKLLMVTGNLREIARIGYLIDLLRHGDQELHLTTIRNEQAYFCNITELMEFMTVENAYDKVLYVCGDSHSLSPSWHTIRYQGQRALLVNALVTGLKCWHLRPESNFYPKYNFYNVVNNLPDHSEVIFIFGEIDCREGILLAVQKTIYKDLEEGIQVAVDIYLNVLVELQRRKQFTIYVHPVLPILDVTRNTVKLFNVVLKQSVERVVRTNHLESKMKWLDFFDQLLTEDRAKLRPEFELDGTHIHPSYLKCVEEALSAVTSN